MQISRIRLSDKTSRLHPRHVVPKPAQTYETKVPVEVREWIGPAPASPDLVLVAQPPAQPRSGIAVERPIRLADRAYLEVVRPAAQRAIQLTLHGPDGTRLVGFDNAHGVPPHRAAEQGCSAFPRPEH